ncbi:unnamed protein product [Lactuca saligna]|uniref:Uncharacterized protein n=1 Tax=Lactuca saligna TaxID=75948 RepID=A0AA35Z4J7_LACSI|nr:unnamed protein product [Lactuca saligna]
MSTLVFISFLSLPLLLVCEYAESNFSDSLDMLEDKSLKIEDDSDLPSWSGDERGVMVLMNGDSFGAVGDEVSDDTKCIEESIHVKFDQESYTDEKVAHSSSIFQELLSCPYDEVSHAEEEDTIPDPIIPDPSSLNQDTAVSLTTHLSDNDETLENEDPPATDVPFSNNTSTSNPVESASGHQDHPVDQIIRNLHDGVRTRSRVSNNFCMLLSNWSRAQAVVAQSGLRCYPQIRAQQIQCLPLLDHHHHQCWYQTITGTR